MIEFPDTEEFAAIVKRIIWFEEPDQALSDPIRFLAYAMTYATFEDMQKIRSYVSDEHLRDALQDAPPGIIDPRSWSYWHVRLDIHPAPKLPSREFG